MSRSLQLNSLFSSLRNRNFKIFISGQCLSLTGTLMQTTAQQWLVYCLTDSPFMLGLITFFQYGPMFLLALPAGVIIDRFNKRKLFLITQTAFFIQSLLLTLLSISSNVQYWQVAILALFYGVVQSFDLPIRQSYFIDLVGADDLPNAISINSAVTNLSKIAGPIISGAFISLFNSVKFCFLFKTLSLIPVIIGILCITADSKTISGTKLTLRVLCVESLESIKYIYYNKDVAKTLLLTFVFCLFSANSQVVLPVFANGLFADTSSGYTTLLAVYGFGGTVAAVFTSIRKTSKTDYKMLILSTAAISVFGIVTMLFRSLVTSVILVFIIGFFYLTFLNISNTMLQFQSDENYRGRMSSIYSMFLMGVPTLGNSFLGCLMEIYGNHTGFLFAGVLTLLMMGAIKLLLFLGHIKQINTSEHRSIVNKKQW